MCENTLEELESMAREVQRRFNGMIEPYRSDLWKYCMALTRSPWDAEDLMQETLLKAYATLAQLFQPVYPKPYLFRIASNAWIDHCRKSRRVDALDQDDIHASDAESPGAGVVIEAMEQLVDTLPPRQVVMILLIDVFDFRIAETADLLSVTEATVKSALQRARARLRAERDRGETTIPMSQGVHARPHSGLLDGFLDAYNKRDVHALVALMDEHISEEDGSVFQVYGREQMTKTCLADWEREPRTLKARHQILWDREVVVVTHEDQGSSYLHSIMELTFDRGAITKWKDYYFSKELLRQASLELRLPLDSSKNLFGN